MAGRTKIKKEPCVYCGSTNNITRDHIPPKQFFSPPLPPLITVPSCAKCNSGFQKDDEYFRIALTMWEELHDHPDVSNLRKKNIQGLRKPQKVRLREKVLRSFVEVEMRSPAGLYLGKRPAFNVDDERLCCVAARIARGLFYHERGQRLPQDFGIRTYSQFSFQEISVETQQVINNLIPILKAQPPKIVGNNAFSYQVRFVPDDPNFSAWLFIFYQCVPFICLTLPRKTKK